MTLNERVNAYATAFPRYPKMWADAGWLMGVWVLGNLYKRSTPYYGAFPGNFLKRVLALFPDRQRSLHLFSGTIQEASTVTVDILPSCRPTVCADARTLPFRPKAFDFVLADPPYSQADADHYGTKMISRRHILKEVRRVVCPGGYCCWLDTVRPMYSKLEWKQVGAVLVLVSTNTRARCLSIMEAG